MKTVVFLGPSIRREKVKVPANTKIAGPIRRGDLDSFHEFDRFVVIDGEFDQSLSVSPKEILRILDQGKSVIGASSMGALRASELKDFGMVGLGWVYRMFVRAAVRQDDDVALTFNPLNFLPTTVPMVNVKYWMEEGRKQGAICNRDGAAVIRAARRVFYADRTEALLRDLVESQLGHLKTQQLLEVSGGTIPDIKSMDAREALEVVGVSVQM